MDYPDDAVAEVGRATTERPLAPVTFLLERMPRSGPATGFLRVPVYLIHGEVFALLERVCRGLAVVFVTCLVFADRRDRLVSASQATLSRVCGIADGRTLAARLRLLQRGQKAAGLPPLLRKLPGQGIRYVFREDGLEILVTRAHETLQAREEQLAAIRKAQSAGGKRGMASRWGSR
jgi:hypothetical protein